MSTRRRNKRTRHPLQSLFLFMVVCAIGYFAWQNRHLIIGNQAEYLTAEQRTEIREKIITEFQRNPDFLTVRSMSWRPHEQRYRLDIELDDACLNPKDVCDDIAEFVREESEMKATVIGVDSTGREIGRAVT